MKGKNNHKLRQRIAGLLLALGIFGGLTAGLTVGLLPQNQTAVTSVPTTDQNSQSQPVQSTAASNLPANFGLPLLWGGGARRPLGGAIPNFTVLKDSAYTLNDTERKAELADLSPESVEEMFTATNAALGDTKVATTDKIISATYNLVKAYDEADDEYGQVVAWASDIQLLDQQNKNKQVAMIYFDGGPSGGPGTFWSGDYGHWFGYARVFSFNEPQFSFFPKRIVGKYGTKAQGNKYFDWLSSATDKANLDEYKQAYEDGRLEDFALFWALSGQMDLTQREMEVAASVAFDIVSAMRFKHLVNQLASEGYEKIAAVGVSYGAHALAETLLMTPETMQKMTGALVSDNIFDRTKPIEEYPGKRIDYNDQWNNGFMDLTVTSFVINWFKTVLQDEENRQQFTQKFHASNVKDDAIVGTKVEGWWDTEQAFWDQLHLDYKIYETGGHGQIMYWQDQLVSLLALGDKRYYDDYYDRMKT